MNKELKDKISERANYHTKERWPDSANQHHLRLRENESDVFVAGARYAISSLCSVLDAPHVLLKNEGGLSWTYYLHICGGSGNNGRGKYRNGGHYDFILYYASPSEMEGCEICERLWCEEKKIVCGEGKTIQEAYENYLKQTQK